MEGIKFYESVEEDCAYYVWEIQRILGVSRRTVFRLIKACNIPRRTIKFGRRNTRKIFQLDLLPIVKTQCFKKYIRRMKESEVKNGQNTCSTDVNCYQNLPESKLHVIFKTPQQLIRMRLLELELTEVEDAMYVGLIPTITIKNINFIVPWFVEALEKRRKNNEES